MMAPGHLGPVVHLGTARICRLGACWEQHGLGVAKKPGEHPTLDLAFGGSSAGSLLEEGNQAATADALDLRPGHVD